MTKGKAYEIFIKHLLVSIGFSSVNSDGLYIFDGTAGQMIQGLAEAHNADVLLEPPVQTPFFAQTRLLIECKNYNRKVGLNILRSALGLREDINHFDIVDMNELMERRTQRRSGLVYDFIRYSYQVAIASSSGYTLQAQNFAVTHRIPLLEFNKMPFWREVEQILDQVSENSNYNNIEVEDIIMELAYSIGRRTAVAITNVGQMIFLYKEEESINGFSENYNLRWYRPDHPWRLISENNIYNFYLPDRIMQYWLENSADEFEMKKEAINCKEQFLSNMIVYYRENGRARIQMISINRDDILHAKSILENNILNY